MFKFFKRRRSVDGIVKTLTRHVEHLEELQNSHAQRAIEIDQQIEDLRVLQADLDDEADRAFHVADNLRNLLGIEHPVVAMVAEEMEQSQ